jgi:hypothetical protein
MTDPLFIKINIMTDPIKFNVGGTRYEVSQSLIDSFPNTLLAKSASKQWNKRLNNEIFIERDGHRFQYVLDYMRDGHANIPVGASKDAVLEDLKYYGFDNIKEVNVSKVVKVDAQTLMMGNEFLVTLMDTAAIINAFCEKKSLSLGSLNRKGASFTNCNDFLKSAGLCVEKEAYDGTAGSYCVTLKLL